MSIINTEGLAFIQGIGGPELLIILLIVLLLFGAKKLPELARGMGKSMKEFRKAASEIEEEISNTKDAVNTPEEKPKQDTAKKEKEPATSSHA